MATIDELLEFREEAAARGDTETLAKIDAKVASIQQVQEMPEGEWYSGITEPLKQIGTSIVNFNRIRDYCSTGTFLGYNDFFKKLELLIEFLTIIKWHLGIFLL